MVSLFKFRLYEHRKESFVKKVKSSDDKRKNAAKTKVLFNNQLKLKPKTDHERR